VHFRLRRPADSNCLHHVVRDLNPMPATPDPTVHRTVLSQRRHTENLVPGRSAQPVTFTPPRVARIS
jgi:hypothetical protein